MLIRPADLEKDALDILDGARDFVSRMEFTEWLPETDEKFVEAVSRIVTHPAMEIIVAEHEGKVVGGIGMMYLPCDWNPELTVAIEKFLWTSRSAPNSTLLRLLKSAEKRMDERKVNIREFAVLTSSPPRIEKIYRQMGMRPIQTAWIGVK